MKSKIWKIVGLVCFALLLSSDGFAQGAQSMSELVGKAFSFQSDCGEKVKGQKDYVELRGDTKLTFLENILRYGNTAAIISKVEQKKDKADILIKSKMGSATLWLYFRFSDEDGFWKVFRNCFGPTGKLFTRNNKW